MVVFLILFNIFTWVAYNSRGNELEKIPATITNIEHRKNILTFQKLFVDKVLKSNGEVDHDARRELERAVGKTDDDAVINV